MDNNMTFEKIYFGEQASTCGQDYCPICNGIGASYIEDQSQRIRIWNCPTCGKIPQNY